MRRFAGLLIFAIQLFASRRICGADAIRGS